MGSPVPDPHVGFGHLLRDHRRASGLSQREMADRAGLSVAVVRDLEQGRTHRPHPRTVRALIAALALGTEAATALRAAAAPVTGSPSDSAERGRLRVAVLGPLTVHHGTVAVTLGRGMGRILLGRLALSNQTPVQATELVDLLWTDRPPASAAAVQACVSRLRAVLEPGRRPPPAGSVLRQAGGGYRLGLADDQLDLATFRRLVHDATQAGTPAHALDLLDRALALWRGDPLADVPEMHGHPAVTALADERTAAVLRHCDIAHIAGEPERALRRVREQAAAHPLHEPLQARLIATLAATGLQAAALDAYADIRRRLRDDLGIDPGPELADVHRRVLRQEFAGPAAGPVPGRAVPAQLPPDVSAFTGRTHELDQLDAMLTGAAQGSSAILISAVSGTAGVGKTALALHWAHRVADRFPDGQLYVDLRGYDPEQPVSADDALAAFLRTLGVSGADVPHDLGERASRYRTLMAGRRMLVLLDNASSVHQVRPLLPGSPSCLVVVTSRDSLAALVARHGARRIQLDLLPEPEALDLLRALIGDRVDADPRTAGILAAQCARLPLALRVAAEIAAARPGVPLTTLLDDLADERRRLDLMDAGGDAHTAIRSVFSWSYRRLPAAAAGLFRLIGLHPGPDLDVYAAAALAGTAVELARPELDRLVGAHLVQATGSGRYGMHDLLRAYAGELAHDAEPESARGAAVRRLLDHYVHRAHAADRVLYPHRDPLEGTVADSPVATAGFTGPGDALAWFTAERPALLAAITMAANAGLENHAWQLTWTTSTFLERQGLWHDWIASGRVAVAAVERAADRVALARAHHSLARAYVESRAYGLGRDHLRRSAELYEELGDKTGRARSSLVSAILSGRLGDLHTAVEHAEQARDLYRAANNRSGEAAALNNIAWYLVRLGDHQPATTYARQALALQRAIDNRTGQANAWDTLGRAQHGLAQHHRALECHRYACDLFRDLGDRYHEAVVLTHIGEVLDAIGDRPGAQDAVRSALAIFEELRRPEADDARSRLAEWAG